MVLEFRVAYATVVGESLWLEVVTHGSGEPFRQLLPMSWRDAQHWEAKVDAELESGGSIAYRYVLRCEDGLELAEWGKMRNWKKSQPVECVIFLDDWRSAGSDDRVYESKIFEVASGPARELGEVNWDGNHEFNLKMTLVPEGMVPCVIGGIHQLGNWDYPLAWPMIEVEPNLWRLRMDLPNYRIIEYKYGLYDVSGRKAVKLESGAENRILGDRAGQDFVKISDECYRRSEDQRFRGAGVAIPVFSIRTEESGGVGEFADLKPMADWASACGLKMIQILPINDTTSSHAWTDSYPYSAISVHALHPLYLRLDQMTYPLVDAVAYRSERESLNRIKDLDYEKVMCFKWRITREVFEKHFAKISRHPGVLGFLRENAGWLPDYAVFSVMRDQHGTADFFKWGEDAIHDPEKIRVLESNKSAMYFIWLQYELDRQLRDAVAHLHAVGVGLKGDLPIGVDRQSVDAWVSPRLFKMDSQTGAPPDAFSDKGQNWGFPTYDWDEMHKDGYAWWRSRFETLSRYFDAYRIDHILGFFRIWQIPIQHVDGVLGTFDPAMPVKLEELEEMEVGFEFNRFCRPFFQADDLEDIFGHLSHGVRQDFMVDLGLGFHGLKPEFLTQRGILDFYSRLTPGDWANHHWIREALLELVGEVLFFEVDGSKGKEFHPRMGMMETRSFRALDEEVQQKLQELHEDYFYRRQERFWEIKAYEKLPAMRSASSMLLCGEDLGMVPGCVNGVMSRLGMLSLEIQRWPKIYGAGFSHPSKAPYMSVVSTGTHDMETLRAWWQDDEQVRARFAWEMLGIAFPEEELSGDMARRIIAQNLDSPAMWAVFPLQDFLAMDENLRSRDTHAERINIPAITPYNWKWRMEISIEQLLSDRDFQSQIGHLVAESGR
jgi:4-alpha-glucanotransferase